MPIRINLLAEEQAVEEMRKRDPVKRAIFVSCGVGILVVIFSVVMVARGMGAKSTLAAKEAEWKGIEPQELAVKADRAEIADNERKLMALNHLAAYRFLWSLPLDSFQKCVTSVDNVNFTSIRVDQSYLVTEPPKARPSKDKDKDKEKEKPKPATSKERIVITIEARDYGKPTDQNYNKLIQAIANYPYFKERLKPNGVILKDLSAPQVDPTDSSKSFVRFVVECQFPEVIRP